ncbi:hypothetical protein G6F60_014177 [Rhizopus arrhizus]|uniref:Uncharacterized protein n=1 Tax=Rhizopus oryzae TaxID=64495 RepID=A0A9P6WUJ9_RHIOR|nr:hypothetical protein G6F23_014271 [Rhizopus arrhizus]KAG0744253.1 hypothetical protein G6F24_016104 [Rhizopus arrhizus]KAG0892184.1 hypothetical protein G6F33_014019 [Rhizopus arrhizus]KAG0921636.1 hypothetical protein G6F32_015010 [Rhizopus arrhizus]KAG1263491.1 hypothetical protein G6F66_014248 [Rhizopus arrhizus]
MVPINKSESQHKSAARALELQHKRDLLMKRAEEVEALAAAERKKLQELMDLRSMKSRKGISQVDDEPKMHAQRRVPEYYYSDWHMLGFESNSLKRARLEDQYMKNNEG